MRTITYDCVPLRTLEGFLKFIDWLYQLHTLANGRLEDALAGLRMRVSLSANPT